MTMDYAQALQIIHDSRRWHGPKRSLERTRALLREVGSPEKKLKFVHVAGTNGKGSTAAMIESILRAGGYRTGLFTSPYITRFNERIRLNGWDIADDELASLVDELLPHTEKLPDAPTEFEIVTILGLMYFAQQNCDIAVLEAGMGGKDDFTNVIGTPETAVITPIGFDHVKQLGPTLADIAAAKAGIIKDGGSVVIYGGTPEADRVFEETCRKRNAALHVLRRDEVILKASDLASCVFDYGEYKNLTVPLAGTYQPYNAGMAIETAEILRDKGFQITDECIRQGIETVSWRGRFEVLREKPLFILDGAHNPPAAGATAQSLREKLGGKKIVFLTGAMADKDVNGIIAALAPLADRFVTVAVNYPRALPAEDYAALIRTHGLEAESAASIAEGVRRAIELAGADGVVCALGTLYFSQDIRTAVSESGDIL